MRRWPRLQAVALYLRLSVLGMTVLMPLLGAASVSPHLPGGQALELLAIALSYHLFAYLLNDVVDLPLDRHEPRRALSPLVRGVVSPRVTLVIALAQVPVGLAMAGRTAGGARAAVYLAVSFALMATYDVLGKRTPVPWVLDVVQGLGWATLLLCGATVRGQPTGLTWALFAFVTVYIVMANGVHGALRDLANDTRQGARSTAIVTGARIDGDGRLTLPRALGAYAWALHLALVVVAFVPPALGQPAMGPWARALTVAVIGGLAALASSLVGDALGPDDAGARRSAGTLHIVLMMALPAAAVFAPLDTGFKVLLVIGFAMPLVALGWFPDAVRWAWRRGPAAQGRRG